MATKDFHQLIMHTLNGACVPNKGLALFPRRIGGHYWMCSRLDGENRYLMSSDVVDFWETAELLQTPKHLWEFMQIENCGSPIETSEGWLMLTHGVEPMRGYCIGAMLLEHDDPQRVIGHLKDPLVVPTTTVIKNDMVKHAQVFGQVLQAMSIRLARLPHVIGIRASAFSIADGDDMAGAIIARVDVDCVTQIMQECRDPTLPGRISAYAGDVWMSG